jgi:hypothetical protein
MSASQAPVSAATADSFDCNTENMPYALSPAGTFVRNNSPEI